MVRVSVLVSLSVSQYNEAISIVYHRTTALYVTHGSISWNRLTDVFLQNNIVNAERRGKRQVLIRPSSKVVVKFLSVMQRHGEYRQFPLSSYVVSWIPSGVITTIDAIVPLRVPRFKAPEYKRTVPLNQITCFPISMETSSL